MCAALAGPTPVSCLSFVGGLAVPEIFRGLASTQEKTLTSPSHFKSEEKYTISNEGKAGRWKK
jgi:hypothetical protein